MSLLASFIGHRLVKPSMLLALLVGLGGCSTSPPEGIKAVTPFDIARYEGQWFELARLDHTFERGMSDVSARYRIQADGSVQVINRGFDTKKNDWKEAIGRAVFTGDPQTASLKVSFFGPFYGGYHVVALDQKDYRWSLVSGQDRDYLWILARTPQLTYPIKQHLIAQAKELGFDTDKLIHVKQSSEVIKYKAGPHVN